MKGCGEGWRKKLTRVEEKDKGKNKGRERKTGEENLKVEKEG